MVDFSAGNNLSPTQVQEIITKVDGLCESIGTTKSQVSCAPIEGRVENSGCITVVNPLKTIYPVPGVVDKKIIVFTQNVDLGYTLPGSDSGGSVVPNVYYDLQVKCVDLQGNETVLWSISNTDVGTLTSRQIIAECNRDDDILICFESRVSGGSLSASVDSSIELCGFVICIGESERSLTGLFKLPDIDEGCCYGREDLYYISQNLDAICASLVINRDQSVNCETVVSNDSDPVLLSGNLTDQTEYLVFGTITVCARSTSEDVDQSLTIRPNVGCASNSIDCINGKLEFLRDEGQNSTNPLQCITLPINACGVCAAGESIYAGLFVDIECITETVVASGSQVELVSVEQNYCVWLFTTADVSTLPGATDLALGKYITEDKLLPLQEKCDDVAEFLANQTEANCTTRELPAPFLTINDTDYIIQEAIAWPPAAPLPRPVPDPPPIKKWNMTLRVCLDHNAFDGEVNTSQRFEMMFTVTVKCGTEELFTETSDFLVYQIGGSDFAQYQDYSTRCITMNECIECDVDEDLNICVDAFAIRNGVTTPVSATIDEANMFCF